MAKPLANGLPIGAILMRDSVAEVIKLGEPRLFSPIAHSFALG